MRSPAASDAAFSGLALRLFAAQSLANPPYRRLGEQRGLPASGVASWRDIPAVPACAFREFEFSCLEPADRTAVFHSSGTTGATPSRHFHGRDSLAFYDDSAWHWFERCVKPPERSRLFILTPPPAAAPHSSLVRMFDTVRCKLSVGDACFHGRADSTGAWHLDLKPLADSLAAAAEVKQPALVLGTAFSFVHLLDGLAGAGRRVALAPGSRVMETGGYKGRSRELAPGRLHELITRQLGVAPRDIVREYGMSELSSQAYCGADGGGFRFPPWARALVVSPETGREVAEGETGLLRVVDLANVWSVMAIQTEDLAVRRGTGFELVGRAALAEPRGCSLMAA